MRSLIAFAVCAMAVASGQLIDQTTASQLPCHYTQTTWDLTFGMSHRMKFDFSGLAATQFRYCQFTLRCPSTATAMAIKATARTANLTEMMQLRSFDAQLDAAGTTYTPTNAGTRTLGGGDTDEVIPNATHVLTAWGDMGYAALQVTCLNTTLIPNQGKDQNYDQVYSSSSTKTIYTNGATEDSMTPITTTGATARRAYDNNDKKSWLVSCSSSDITTTNHALSLYEIEGSTGTNDILTVYALDSGMSRTFSGDNNGTDKWSWDISNDTATWSASTQYYVTWESDATTGSSPDEERYRMKFACRPTDGTTAARGAGVDIGNDPKNANPSGVAGVSVVTAALFTLVLAAF